jgi:hypothetical protein
MCLDDAIVGGVTMNSVERIIDGELISLLDRLASSVPPEILSRLPGVSPTLRPRLDEAEAHLADVRATLLVDYGRWRRALEDVENLWALASWRSAAAQEPVPQGSRLAA